MFAGLIFLLLTLRVMVSLVLLQLNRREAVRNAGQIPAPYIGIIDESTYKKSVRYTLDKLQLGMVSEVLDGLLLAAVLFSGLLPALFDLHHHMLGHGLGAEALLLIIVPLLLALPSLPLEWWQQFRLEESHGFNRMTTRLWLVDRLKGTALALAIGYPVALVVLWLVRWSPGLWWWHAFLFLTIFQMLMLVLVPKLILPLFNKLSPLPEGELKERMMQLIDKTGFKTQSLHVMDGSKRSGHSNAFFTGFGKFRRVVLFDTLMSQLNHDELEAVLAHEIGHYQKGHIPKSMLLRSAMLLGGLYILSLILREPRFYTAFGFAEPSAAAGFILFSLLAGLFTFWISPIGNILSRKNEYEADAYAVQTVGNPAPLVSALRKLNEKNLGNLCPHPLYSFFHYSHPTISEREAAMKGVSLLNL